MRAWTFTKVTTAMLLLGGSSVGITIAARGPVRHAGIRHSQTAAPSGAEILHKVLIAEGRVRISARQSVVISSDKTAEAVITEETHLGNGLARIQYVLPKSSAGRVVASDGRWRWEYHPESKVVIKTGVLRMPASPQKAQATLERVLRSYRVSIDHDSSSVSGRDTWILRFDPLSNDRPKRRWWVDKETFFILRREVYDLGGALDQITSYSNVSYNVKTTRSALKFSPPKGVRVISRSLPKTFTTLQEARKRVPSWARIPDTMGHGFEFASARIVSIGGTAAVHLHFTDGLTSLSFMQAPGQTETSPSGSSRVVQIGTASGMLSQPVPSYRVLSWSSRGQSFSLVGDLDEKSLVAVARTLL